MNATALGSLFRTIGDASRLRLLQMLSQHELSVSELVRVLSLPQSTVSRHLRALKDEGLVADRPAGSATYYRATIESEVGNGETALRDSLASILRESELSAADKAALERVVAERSAADEQFFERIGWRWDSLRESCFGPTFHLEAFLCVLPRQWSVADLGTGTGYLLPVLGRNFSKVIGVDNSRSMLDLAERRLAEQGLEQTVELREGDLEKLPLDDASIDLALAFLMLHHLPSIPAALAEVRRVLKPGGRLLVVEQHEHGNEAFRVQMADRRSGVAPDALADYLAKAQLSAPTLRELGTRCSADTDLDPVPALYVAVAEKFQ